MHAPPKSEYPIATVETLIKYDAFLFGVPTRYGSVPAQVKTFWDATGQIWVSGALYGKKAGVFVSTGGPGGQETTVMSLLPNLVHHGISFVPLGYKNMFQLFGNFNEVHGGGPWGAGTFVS
jgi:NAD(P)H dehydrogenase (quinone)